MRSFDIRKTKNLLVEAKPRRVAKTTEPTVKDLLLLADAVILKVAQPYLGTSYIFLASKLPLEGGNFSSRGSLSVNLKAPCLCLKT